LLDLCIHFCLLDLAKLLTFAYLLAFHDSKLANDATDFERQSNLVLVNEHAAGANSRRCRAFGGYRHTHWRGRRRLFLCCAIAAGRSDAGAQNQ
jgi:hypothetical protein